MAKKIAGERRERSAMRSLRCALSFLFVCALLAPALRPELASAGTTGNLVGRVTDPASHAGIAGARVTVASPSQTASVTAGADGAFQFLALAPDTYVVSVERPGYEPFAQSGITVLADQSQSVPIALTKGLRTIGSVRARSGSDLVRSGTTADVYSVNAAGAEAARGLGGPGGINSAYSAIASVPGTVVQQGQQGWYQTVSIRGGDIDQVGYEVDGIPANRVYDNAPQTLLSNLGQQELQVYTGGTPASAEASGIAGYINQVIKTGTYPGFANLDAGLGGPAFYHKLSFEAGGADKSRTFTYYVGLAGVDQDFRFADQFNGVSDAHLFYPVSFPGRFNLYDGTAGTVNLAPGATYAIAHTTDRENVANVHFAIPHHGDPSLRDDVQLLYLTSENVASYFSSINDQGGAANVATAVGNGGQGYQHDGYVYTGPLFAPPNAAGVTPYLVPNSGKRPFDTFVSANARDYSDNGVALTKIQLTHQFSPASYLKLYGYTEYSNWFIGGPSNQQFTNYYGAELNDYELPSHTFGLNATYTNQLSSRHQLTATGSYTASQVQRRFSYGFPGNTIGAPFTSLVDAGGSCYDPATAAPTSCFNSAARGTFPSVPPNGDLSSYRLPSGTLAVTNAAGAQATATWLVTDNGYINSRLNTVSPVFAAASVADFWRPNDRLTVNLGMRVENYDNRLGDTGGGPARDFWFAAYNREHCYVPGAASPVNVFGQTDPVTNALVTASSTAVCRDLLGASAQAANLVNAGATTVSKTDYEPRFGFTYDLDPRTVLRGSVGVYARPVNTSWLQYNAVNSDLASFLGGNFLTLGYNSTTHPLQPDTSLNADFSIEKALPGGTSFKLTPYYRGTTNQLQPVPIGVGGVVAGFNVGKQTSTGIELAVKQGDFARNGFAAQLAYTYTRSRITYGNFPSGTNVIDGLNQYLAEYNSYTSACATVTAANGKLCGLAAGAKNPNASASFASADGHSQIGNPYYAKAAQPLFDARGSYTTYDQIPQPFTGENGYETPHVASLVLNYKHDRFSITPSLTFSSGAKYGSPLAYPGYVPTGCAAAAGAAGAVLAADPKTCTGLSAVSGQTYLLIPDAFTGRFDTLGAFDEPSRLTLNLGASYAPTKRLTFTGTLTGLVDKCFQRGYAWDDPNICVYSQLPSGGAGLGPSGNFLPVGSTPVQFRYPYGVFNNNLNTGFVGSTIPFAAFLSAQVKM